MITAVPRGLSARAIATNGRDCVFYPHDPDDFIRCEMYLRAHPEVLMRFPSMRRLSSEWGILIDHWYQIVTLLSNECGFSIFAEMPPRGVAAPQTYQYMRNLLHGVQTGTPLTAQESIDDRLEDVLSLHLWTGCSDPRCENDHDQLPEHLIEALKAELKEAL